MAQSFSSSNISSTAKQGSLQSSCSSGADCESDLTRHIKFDFQLLPSLNHILPSSHAQPQSLDIKHAITCLKAVSHDVFAKADLLNMTLDEVSGQCKSTLGIIEDHPALQPCDKIQLSDIIKDIEQRFVDFKIDALEKEGQELYQKAFSIDKAAPAFHHNAAQLWHRQNLTPQQRELIEHQVIRFGLGQNMVKADRDRCLAAFFNGSQSGYARTLNKWVERCLSSKTWDTAWPRKPLVAAWLEHAYKCTYTPLSDQLVDKLKQVITADAPLISTKVDAGFKGISPGHQFGWLFPGNNKPATFKIEKVESAEVGIEDVKKASALKLTFSFPAEQDKQLPALFTPGQHMAIMKLSNTSDEFKKALAQDYSQVLDKPEFENTMKQLSTEKFKYYTVESQQGGNNDGTLSIYLRVQKDDPESNSLYLAGLKKGDCGLTGFPATDFTRCPKPQTPMLMFGQGTSASLANTFAKSRMEQNKKKVKEFAPSYIVMNYRSHAQRFAAKELRKTALHSPFNMRFRSLVSAGDHIRPHVQKSESNRFLEGIKVRFNHALKTPPRIKGAELGLRLLQDRHEFDMVQSLILNPDTHVYFSGILGVAEDTMDHVKTVAQSHNLPIGLVENAIIMAKQEGRFHVEGSVARNLESHYQGI